MYDVRYERTSGFTVIPNLAQDRAVLGVQHPSSDVSLSFSMCSEAERLYIIRGLRSTHLVIPVYDRWTRTRKGMQAMLAGKVWYVICILYMS